MQGSAISVARGGLSWSEVAVDWDGGVVDPPVAYGFCLVGEVFHFHAKRAAPPVLHPTSASGAFQPELWKYDVAEFFLSHPTNGSYLEVNLAPHGAWWSCLFRGPRIPWDAENVPLEGVSTTARVDAEGWEASLTVPLATLEAGPVGFGEGWGLNATFIIDSPRQRFLTACPLGPGEPDFHRPAAFLPLSLEDEGAR